MGHSATRTKGPDIRLALFSWWRQAPTLNEHLHAPRWKPPWRRSGPARTVDGKAARCRDAGQRHALDRAPSLSTIPTAVRGEVPISWSSPVEYDPALLDRLRAAHVDLLAAVVELNAAVEAGREDATSLAAHRCLSELHGLQRLESMQLYPVIARSCAANAEDAHLLATLRHEIHALGRKFLRLLEEGLYHEPDMGWPASQRMLASAMLSRYVSEKETYLFPMYIRAMKPAS
jgi:hypothetical protein